ncbi:hypothetical protein VTI74DRAFT_9098 [Chaetomium olivicolor]
MGVAAHGIVLTFRGRGMNGGKGWPRVTEACPGLSPNDQPHTSYSPVFFRKSGRIFCQPVYRIFEGTNLLTPAQWHALSVFEKCANESAIELDVQPGDIQLVNNLAVLHARRGWIDLPGRRERHYYRLGLRDPKYAWDRPDGYEDVFDDRFDVLPEEQTILVTDFDPYGLLAWRIWGMGRRVDTSW